VKIVTMSDLRKEHPGYVVPWDAAMASGRTFWEERHTELEGPANEVTPNDICALIYTSGTTGNPKGVMLTHENFCSNAKAALGIVPFGPGDHHLSFLPLCHSFERTAGYTAVLAAGGRISYAESIDTVNRNLGELSPTVLISVPRLFERIYNIISNAANDGPAMTKRIFDWAVSSGKRYASARRHGRSPGPFVRLSNTLAQRLVFAKLHEKLGGRLRFAVSGGAALPRAIGEFFEAAGIQLIEGYGLTETSPVLSANPIDRPRYGTVGHILPGMTVAIQRLTDGKIVGRLSGEDYPSSLTTEEGEIIVKGPNVMKGYWNNEEATREAIDSDGWYHTGDVGRYADGYLQITDRIKHMIVSKGGKNIYPGPIEDGFKTVPWIDQLLVVGEGREFLTALVVPDTEVLRKFATEAGLSVTDDEALVANEEVVSLFSKEFRAYSKTAAAHEKIRDFRIVLEPFTVENTMMTPTMKPRRKIIEVEYEELIDEMYVRVV
jgi:long-chain acyl-CoA synthetase